MNTAITYYDLPPAEKRVADLYAWGFTKKEIANLPGEVRSIRTIETQVANLFKKTETRKDTEFASWYFCTRFNISLDFSPMKRGIVCLLLAAIVGLTFFYENNYMRPARSVKIGARIERCARRAKFNT